jgi:Raf kinase inhibitor-like YbhB/YbcL family protein
MVSRGFSFVVVAGLAVLLVGCGSKSEVKPESSVAMKVESIAFKEGGEIPLKYSAYGNNISPPLSWSGVPDKAESLVLILDDPDAPSSEPFVHWIVCNIPPTSSGIAEGQVPENVVLGANGMNRPTYFGPRPPEGTHRYYFRLFALDKLIGLRPGANRADIEKSMDGHVIAKGQLMGTYTAPAKSG